MNEFSDLGPGMLPPQAEQGRGQVHFITDSAANVHAYLQQRSPALSYRMIGDVAPPVQTVIRRIMTNIETSSDPGAVTRTHFVLARTPQVSDAAASHQGYYTSIRRARLEELLSQRGYLTGQEATPAERKTEVPVHEIEFSKDGTSLYRLKLGFDTPEAEQVYRQERLRDKTERKFRKRRHAERLERGLINGSVVLEFSPIDVSISQEELDTLLAAYQQVCSDTMDVLHEEVQSKPPVIDSSV